VCAGGNGCVQEWWVDGASCRLQGFQEVGHKRSLGRRVRVVEGPVGGFAGRGLILRARAWVGKVVV